MPLSLARMGVLVLWSGVEMAQLGKSVEGTIFSPLSARSTNVKITRFAIAGDPVAWARPRFNNGRAFTADRQRGAKDSLSWAIAMGWGKPKIPRETPVSLCVEFVFRAAKKKDIGQLRPRRPDIDNLLKLVMDAMQGVVFEDDGQIADVRVMKRWGETSETRIEIVE